jgi:hypothetical protein
MEQWLTIQPGFLAELGAGMLAQFEFLIFVVILIISALFNWLKKKSQEAEEWGEFEAPPPPPRQPSRTPHAPPPLTREERKPYDWQEELRRMLEGQEPKPPPAPAKPPPLIIQQPPPRPPARYDHSRKPARVKVPQRVQTVVPDVRRAEIPVVPAVSLEPTNVVIERPRVPGRIRRPTRSPEVERAVAMFHSSESLRQAVVASVILDAPKALEGEKLF